VSNAVLLNLPSIESSPWQEETQSDELLEWERYRRMIFCFKVEAIARKFGVCLFSACRIRECCTLLTQDIYTSKGSVRPQLIIRKSNTKGKLVTRSIPVIEDLRRLLREYYPLAGESYLFPGRSDEHISEDSAARILRTACSPSWGNWRVYP
jgi:integrase